MVRPRAARGRGRAGRTASRAPLPRVPGSGTERALPAAWLFIRNCRRGACESGSAFFPTLAPANEPPAPGSPPPAAAPAGCQSRVRSRPTDPAGDKGEPGHPARARLWRRRAEAGKSPRPLPRSERCAGRGPLREGGGARLTFRASWGRGKSERRTREGNRVRRPRGAGEPRPARLCSPRTQPGPRASARPANLTPAGCSTCTRPVTQWTWNTSRWAGDRLAGQGRRQAEWHHETSERDATRRAE